MNNSGNVVDCLLIVNHFFQLFHRQQPQSTILLSRVVAAIDWPRLIDGATSSHQQLLSIHVTLFHLLISLASNKHVTEVILISYWLAIFII